MKAWVLISKLQGFEASRMMRKGVVCIVSMGELKLTFLFVGDARLDTSDELRYHLLHFFQAKNQRYDSAEPLDQDGCRIA